MKSIFDLDYDEDDAPAVNNRLKHTTIQVVVPERRSVKKPVALTIQQEPLELSVTNETENVASTLTTWECIEDEDCVAGQYQKMQGTCSSQDVELLHKCYVEGLNGNWNGLSKDKCPEAPVNEPPCADIDYEKHQLYKRVVPSCSHLLMDKLLKVVDAPSVDEDRVCDTHSPLLSSFSELSAHHHTGLHSDSGVEFREWFELLNVPSFNDDTLTILPYVVID